MSRKTTTTVPEDKSANVSDVLIAKDFEAADQLALAMREADTRTRAIATQLGYQLPADCTDPDLIQRDIAANMRRSVEACLEVGRGLTVLKAACQHGQFLARLDVLCIDPGVAQKFMRSAAKFSNASSTTLLKAAGSQTKLFEMLVLDDEQVEELELTGQTGELSLDDVATMSVKELRAAVRGLRQDKVADQKVLANKNAQINKLEHEMALFERLPEDKVFKRLLEEATRVAQDGVGLVRGTLRQALISIKNHDTYDNSVAMAGLVGQLQAALTALRQEFDLPDVSAAAAQELAKDVAEWAFPKGTV